MTERLFLMMIFLFSVSIKYYSFSRPWVFAIQCQAIFDVFNLHGHPSSWQPLIPPFLRLPPPSYHHTLSVSPSPPPPPLLYISFLVSHLSSPFAPLHDASFVVDIDVSHVKPASSLRPLTPHAPTPASFTVAPAPMHRQQWISRLLCDCSAAEPRLVCVQMPGRVAGWNPSTRLTTASSSWPPASSTVTQRKTKVSPRGVNCALPLRWDSECFSCVTCCGICSAKLLEA